MAWTIPTLKEMAERAASSFNANLRGADAKLFPNNVYVSAKVIAGAVWEALSFVAYIKRQIFVHSADSEHLDKHATDYGMARLAATFASGYVELTGVDGTTIAAGEQLQRSDGARYTITGGGTVASGTVTVSVSADVAGLLGNSAAGVGMALVTPIVGLDGTGAVAVDGLGGGADTESDEALRTRLLHRKQNPPRGGSTADYVAWALAVNGVSDVYVDPVTATNGRSTVGVWFLMWGVYPNGIPQGADVSLVFNYIDSQRPAGAVVDVAAPAPVSVNITATNVSPLTTEVIDAINLALQDLFRRSVRVSTATEPYKLWRSQIIEAIATATGEDHHVLTAPATDVTYTTGQYPVLGVVTLS